MIDVVILNRNLGEVCDDLVLDLIDRGVPPESIEVIDAASNPHRRSRYTTYVQDDEFTKRHGLRFARGMNLGLAQLSYSSLDHEWVALLPVDVTIQSWQLPDLLRSLDDFPEVAIVCPIEEGSPYGPLLRSEDLIIAWEVEDGPLLVKKDFILKCKALSAEGEFFDRNNFRSSYYTLDLALRAYLQNQCLAVTNLVTFREDESFLRHHFEEIGTDSYEKNAELLAREGAKWISQKYGAAHVWEFAMLVRLAYEEFLRVNPKYESKGVVNVARG